MEILEVQLPIGVGADIDALDNLKKVKLARAQEKTREELDIINSRVKHIFEDYEFGEQMSAYSASSNIEFMADITELQSILGDVVKKSKYQQKVSIFIVGFQDICKRRMKLLDQISEFFETYSAPNEVEEVPRDSLEGIDIEAINDNIQTALDTMDTAMIRLNELNQDIMGYMNTMHSALTSKSMKNKKKLEKNLALAKEDIVKVTEKLQMMQQELKAKEEQVQRIRKQMDNKTKELQNFKMQLDKTRKNMNEAEKELNVVRFSHEDEMRRMQGYVEGLNKQLQELKDEKALSYRMKIQEIVDASLAELAIIKGNFSDDEQEQNEFRKEIALQYRVQKKQIEYIQSEELAAIQHEYRKGLAQMLEIEVSDEDIQQWGKEGGEEVKDEERNEDEEAADDAKPDSRPRTTPGSVLGDEEDLVTPVSPRLSEKESSPGSRHHLMSSSVEALKGPVDLSDEEFWENVPEHELPMRFAEFREEAMKQIEKFQTMAMHTTTNEDFAQKHKEERKKWKEDKTTLLEHIQQLQKLQEEAEADADEAMRQLEEYASHQDETPHPEEKAQSDQGIASSGEANREEDAKSREQATSPDCPKPLSSVSKQSVASLVEEKRAAMMKRKESANRLLNTSESKQGAGSGHTVMDTEAFENFSKSYKMILQFKEHVGGMLAYHPHSQSLAHNLKSASTHELTPDENETDEMAYSIEKTLSAVESMLKSLISSLPTRESNRAPPAISILQHDVDGEENVKLKNKISLLQSEMELMKEDFERRAQHDASTIQQLQNAMSNMKQDNIPANMQITTNTPSVPVPIPTDHLLTMSQGNRGQTADSGMTMMFTRIDAERNTKILTKSTKSGKINQATLDSLTATMSGYNQVAAARLHQLVQKIAHHTSMKDIETNVRNSNLVTSEVFDILEKMEDLQRRRAQNWSRQMDELSARRKRLGLLLQDAMQRLERITGVFLIKPIISHPGKVKGRKYSGKVSTKFNKYQLEAMAAKEQCARHLDSDYMKFRASGPTYNPQPSRGVPWTAQSMQLGREADRDALTVSGLNRANAPTIWSLDSSIMQTAASTKKEKWSPSCSSFSPTVPKLVELDVGRYLHGINPIHAYTSQTTQLKSPRVIPGPAKIYAGITRVGGSAGSEIFKLKSGDRRLLEKPQATATVQTDSSADDYQSTVPPTTPASQTQIRRGSSGVGLLTPNSEGVSVGSPSLPRPLPPIQVPSRSRASTRSSLTASSLKEYCSPSPTKSLPPENSPDFRSKSDVLMPDEEIMRDGNSSASPLPAYVEIAK